MWSHCVDYRWPVRIGVVGALAACLFLLPTTPALASDGLDIGSNTTYTVDPEGGVVAVSAEYTLTNTTRNRTKGGVITRYYYDHLTVPVPASAENLVATSAGRTLRLDIEEEVDFFYAEVSLRKNLWSGQTQTFELTYDLPNEPPRSGELVRVNAAYAAFPAYGIGDPGDVSVSVRVPNEFQVDMIGADIVPYGTEDGFTTYRAEDIEDPDEWFLFVTARNDDGLSAKVVTVDGRSAIIRHWPDDEEWLELVEQQFIDAIPVMEDLTGVPWPLEDHLTVIETVSPNLYGAAGWFILDERLIEVDEALDPEVILHEFSHAWFNHSTVVNRWLSEGLAEELAARTLQTLTGEVHRPVRVGASTPGALPLNEWDAFRNESLDNERDAYGYDASWWVIRRITEKIGMDGLEEVLVAMNEGHAAYSGEGEARSTELQKVGWRRFLDLTEELGGSEVIDDLFADYVVASHHLDDLADRDAARDAYQDLQDEGAEWAAPVVVRRDMENWKFDSAVENITAAAGVLDRRDTLIQEASALGLTPNGRLEKLYEDASMDLDAAVTDSFTHLDSVEAVADAGRMVEADRDLFTQIGLWGSPDPSEAYRAVRDKFESGRLVPAISDAHALIDGLNRARGVGQSRAMNAALGLSGLMGVALAIKVIRRRRQAGFEATLEAPFIGPVMPDPVPSAEAVDL